MWKATFHPSFWSDVERQARYLQREAELGGAFLDAVEVAIQSVLHSPKMRSTRFGITRRIILRRFRSHLIYYEMREAAHEILFLGLFHGAEDPLKWKRRAAR